MDRVGIVGTGLIGASIGLGLRARGGHVVGWDPDPEAIASAIAVGAVDEEADSEDVLYGSGLGVRAYSFIASRFCCIRTCVDRVEIPRS